jgi:hypothetical protein
LRDLFDENSSVLLQVDMVNAFNSLDRAKLLEKVYSTPSLSPMWSFVDLCYGEPTPLYAFHEGSRVYCKMSEQGVRQGSVLGPILFALAINDIIEEVNKTHEIVAYLDDMNIITDPTEADAVLAQIEKLLLPWGLKVNRKPNKTSILSKEEIRSTVTVKTGWSRVLGSVFGFCKRSMIRFCDDVADSHFSFFQIFHDKGFTLKLWHKHLLLEKSGVARLTFLLRSTPPEFTRSAAEKFDEMLFKAASTIFNWELSPISQAIIKLPFRLGGCGLRPQTRIWGVAYESSLEGLKNEQCARMKVIEKKEREEIIKQLETADPPAAIVFRNQGKSHAWMNCWQHEVEMSEEAWVMQMKLRTLSTKMPAVENTVWECTCGKIVNDFLHVMSCTKFSKTARHDAVKKVLVECLESLGIKTVAAEPKSNTAAVTQERLDISFTLLGVKYMLDVTVIFDGARDLQDRRKDVLPKDRLKPIEMARDEKIRANTVLAQAQMANFIPIAFSYTGKLETTARKWFNSIGRKKDRPDWAASTIAKLSATVANENANLVWAMRDAAVAKARPNG